MTTDPTGYGKETTGEPAPPVNKCGNWKAWHDFMPGGKPTLYVTGQCTFPSLGYQVELRIAEPQGINPTILILDKIVTPPEGMAGTQVVTIDVRFEYETATHYKQVEIRPDGVVLDVQEVH